MVVVVRGCLNGPTMSEAIEMAAEKERLLLMAVLFPACL